MRAFSCLRLPGSISSSSSNFSLTCAGRGMSISKAACGARDNPARSAKPTEKRGCARRLCAESRRIEPCTRGQGACVVRKCFVKGADREWGRVMEKRHAWIEHVRGLDRNSRGSKQRDRKSMTGEESF
eukprot:scaffold246095_cov33-Tisochrysis_lutea.AAC.3